jgi:hypothetical protein
MKMNLSLCFSECSLIKRELEQSGIINPQVQSASGYVAKLRIQNCVCTEMSRLSAVIICFLHEIRISLSITPLKYRNLTLETPNFIHRVYSCASNEFHNEQRLIP